MKQSFFIYLFLAVAMACAGYLILREVRQSQTLLPAMQIQSDMASRQADHELMRMMLSLIERQGNRSSGQDSGLWLLIGLLTGAVGVLLFVLSQNGKKEKKIVYVVSGSANFKQLPYEERIYDYV